MKQTIGLPKTVLADTGFASAPAVVALQAEEIEPLVAIGRTKPHRPYDFRPPPKARAARRITEPWRVQMKAKLETEDGRTDTKSASKPSNRSLASSRARSASSASTFAVSATSP